MNLTGFKMLLCRSDKHGNSVQATYIPGDHWRCRHDSLVQLTYEMCLRAGVTCETEIFNLFQSIICQDGLSRIEKAKQRKVLVSDLRVTVPPLTVVSVGGSPPTGLHFGPNKTISKGHCSNKLDIKLSFVYYII